jgi:hypothetical protein
MHPLASLALPSDPACSDSSDFAMIAPLSASSNGNSRSPRAKAPLVESPRHLEGYALRLAFRFVGCWFVHRRRVEQSLYDGAKSAGFLASMPA